MNFEVYVEMINELKSAKIFSYHRDRVLPIDIFNKIIQFPPYNEQNRNFIAAIKSFLVPNPNG